MLSIVLVTQTTGCPDRRVTLNTFMPTVLHINDRISNGFNQFFGHFAVALQTYIPQIDKIAEEKDTQTTLTLSLYEVCAVLSESH